MALVRCRQQHPSGSIIIHEGQVVTRNEPEVISLPALRRRANGFTRCHSYQTKTDCDKPNTRPQGRSPVRAVDCLPGG
ncbi:hypothetical protein NDU88_004325 [Pleurodeles waltl]|uniref:Uncharacterized protein n=1 Tax=Pleurodeles waltl TaxID=8319 RepID=A0AAV7QBL1_PLEWA|nr:hypothetical protein NDU88_004325 [Pleurodeles waltl]